MNQHYVGRFAIAAALVALSTVGARAQGPAVPASAVPASAAMSASMSASMSAKEAKAANRKLQKDVIRVLARTKGLSVTHITVRANNGNVTLEGAVPEQVQIDLATEAAKGVAGVASVRNALTLSTF